MPRLTTPMVRDDGVLREATWDEALTRASEGFAKVKDELGPEGFAVFSCSRSTNEMNYAAERPGIVIDWSRHYTQRDGPPDG